MRTNQNRAAHAALTLMRSEEMIKITVRPYEREGSGDLTEKVSREEAISDLLCDLMHLCDKEGLSFEDLLSGARVHFEAERAEDETA